MNAKNAKWANKQFTTKWSKIFAIMMSWFAPISAFAQERSYDWGWGGHPMMCGTREGKSIKRSSRREGEI